MEYDGSDHLDPDRVVMDIERNTRLAAAGWCVLRYTHRDIRHRAARVVHEVGATLGQAASV